MKEKTHKLSDHEINFIPVEIIDKLIIEWKKDKDEVFKTIKNSSFCKIIKINPEEPLNFQMDAGALILFNENYHYMFIFGAFILKEVE